MGTDKFRRQELADLMVRVISLPEYFNNTRNDSLLCCSGALVDDFLSQYRERPFWGIASLSHFSELTFNDLLRAINRVKSLPPYIVVYMHSLLLRRDLLAAGIVISTVAMIATSVIHAMGVLAVNSAALVSVDVAIAVSTIAILALVGAFFITVFRRCPMEELEGIIPCSYCDPSSGYESSPYLYQPKGPMPRLFAINWSSSQKRKQQAAKLEQSIHSFFEQKGKAIKDFGDDLVAETIEKLA